MDVGASAKGTQFRQSAAPIPLPAREAPLVSLRDTDVQPSVRRRDTLNRRALAVADALSCLVALSLAVAVLGNDGLDPAALLTLPLIVLLAKVLGLYDRDEMLLRRSTLDESPRLFQLATLWTLIVWIAEPYLVNGALSKREVLGLWASVFVVLLVMRTLARLAARSAAPPERCVVLGDRISAQRLRATFMRAHGVKA